MLRSGIDSPLYSLLWGFEKRAHIPAGEKDTAHGRASERCSPSGRGAIPVHAVWTAALQRQQWSREVMGLGNRQPGQINGLEMHYQKVPETLWIKNLGWEVWNSRGKMG